MTNSFNPQFFFVFDVESIGLHGEGFAVAWVVINKKGERQEEGMFSCPPEYACGPTKDREWVAQFIPALEVTHGDPRDLRSDFWNKWIDWKVKGALLVADCNWPVEARFLSMCIDDNHKERCWDGPYPFLDLGSMLFAAEFNPLESFERLQDELPIHHPLADARQSARILQERILRGWH